MTSYRYCHKNGYQPEGSDENVKSICETLRTTLSIDTFRLYAVVNDAYGTFLESHQEDGYDFVQGLYFDIDDKQFIKVPSNYKNLEYTNDLKFEKAMFPAAIPNPTPVKSDILGKLVDAIVFGEKDKTVAIVVRNEKEAYSYLWHISEALPDEYMKRVGYCIAEKYVELNGEAKAKISFITKEIDEYDYRVICEEAYVFDTVNQRNNYGKGLEDISLTIEKLYNSQMLTHPNNQKILSTIFKNGRYDEKRGKIFATKNLYEVNSTEVSFKFLDLYTEAPDDLKRDLTIDISKAIDYVKKHIDELNKEQISKLLAFKDKCPNYKGDVDKAYLSYMELNMGKISEEDERKCKDAVLKDKSGATFNDFIDAVSAFEDFKKYHQAFKIIADVIVEAGEQWDNDAYCDAITKAIEFCDIEIMHSEIARDTSQSGNGEKVFEYANLFDKEDDKNLIYAILMISAYRKNIDNTKKAIRIKSLMYAIKKLFPKQQREQSKKIIEKIIRIREKMVAVASRLDSNLDVSHNLGNFMMDDRSDNNRSLSHADEWIRETVKEFYLLDLVEIDSELGEEPPYEGMIDKIYEKLVNFDFFKAQMTNITKGDDVNQIEAVYEKIWNVEKNRNDGLKKIMDFLNNLRQEGASSRAFKEFRTEFVNGWINTFSNEDKKEYLDGADFATLVKEKSKETTKIIEQIDNGYSRFEKITQKKKKIKLVPVRTLLFAVIAAVIMVIPPVVQSLLLEGAVLEPMLDYVKSYFEMIYLAVPVGVAIIHLFVYNVASKDNLQRANRAAVVCGILPVTFFVISFLAFWFLNIDILSMFK